MNKRVNRKKKNLLRFTLVPLLHPFFYILLFALHFFFFTPRKHRDPTTELREASAHCPLSASVRINLHNITIRRGRLMYVRTPSAGPGPDSDKSETRFEANRHLNGSEFSELNHHPDFPSAYFNALF